MDKHNKDFNEVYEKLRRLEKFPGGFGWDEKPPCEMNSIPGDKGCDLIGKAIDHERNLGIPKTLPLLNLTKNGGQIIIELSGGERWVEDLDIVEPGKAGVDPQKLFSGQIERENAADLEKVKNRCGPGYAARSDLLEKALIDLRSGIPWIPQVSNENIRIDENLLHNRRRRNSRTSSSGLNLVGE